MQLANMAGEGGGIPADGVSAGVATGLGEVSVIEKVVGYKKIKFHTHENIGYGDVRLPELQMHTSAFWATASEEIIQGLPFPRAAAVDALRGIGKAMHTIAAVGLMIDPRDLGHTVGDRGDTEGPPKKDGAPGFDPTLFFFDRVPGGVGLAPRLFEERESLLLRTRALIESCPCGDGCPSCIGPSIGAEELAISVSPNPSRARAAAAAVGERKGRTLMLLSALGVAPMHRCADVLMH